MPHSDRVVDFDQIVGGVSEEGLPATSSGPASCRIGRRDELGRDLGRRAESSVVEHSQILLNGSAGGFRRQPFLALDALLPVGVRLDQAGINRKAFAATRPSSMQRCRTVSKTRRRRSLSRKRPCRFFEKVE